MNSDLVVLGKQKVVLPQMANATKLRITGRVQYIGYRRYILDLARQHGLAGYVKNERDGSVTIFAQGDEPGLARFLEGARNPPTPNLVKDFEELPGRPDARQRYFTIRFGTVPEELQEGFGAMQTEFRDYREEFREYRGEFRKFAERTDESFNNLDAKYGWISLKLTNILETLETESVEMRRELTRAVDNLAKLVQEYVGRKQ